MIFMVLYDAASSRAECDPPLCSLRPEQDKENTLGCIAWLKRSSAEPDIQVGFRGQ